MNKIWIASVLLVTLVGCSGSSPAERTIYLLRAEPPKNLAPADPEALIGFSNVRLAPYLQRTGIVVELAEHQVREATFHAWAEPLDQAIALYLREQVAFHLGRELDTGVAGDSDSWRYRIGVSIERLHGSLDGEVQIAARFTVHDEQDGTPLASERFSETLRQAQPGYPALVESEIALLDGLARSIARALR